MRLHVVDYGMTTTTNNSRATWTAYLLAFNNCASATYNRHGRHWVIEASNWAADGIALEGYFTVVPANFERTHFIATRTRKAHQG